MGGAGGQSGRDGGIFAGTGGNTISVDAGIDSPVVRLFGDAPGCSPAMLPYGSVHCVNRAELADPSVLPDLLIDGGIDALGSDTDWRCPDLAEVNFAACSYSETCCTEWAQCGPVLEHSPFDAGVLPDAAEDGEQLCCYLTEFGCGA